MSRNHILLLLAAATVIVAGCQRVLVDSPNLYLHAEEDPFADVPAALRSCRIDLLYMTDREPQEDSRGNLRYGIGRSSSMAFGSCYVEIGRDVTWDELAVASRSKRRSVSLPLRLGRIEELGRFPKTPPPLEVVNGLPRPAREYAAPRDAAVAAFHDELRRRLAMTDRKSVLVFVHGFNNSMQDAAFRLAEMWHFLGREGVSLLYTWPAGSPGMIQGYTRDRESSEFTIFHLKETLRALAACPEVEHVDIVSHSRGTDVTSTALRELCMVSLAEGLDPQTQYKIDHVIYAAPDLDMEVLAQRYSTEQADLIARHITIYVTAKDRALGSAEWLFSSPNRVGRMRPEHMDERMRQRVETSTKGEIVDSRIKTDFLGHSYFLNNSATFSDLILVLRYHRKPGAENGRPLTELLPNWYILNDDYPMIAAPLPRQMQEK